MEHRWGGAGTLPNFDHSQCMPAGLRAIFGLQPVKPEPECEVAPPPTPLAVIKPGPIDDVMQRLEEARSAYPNAELHKGKRGTWELWPS
ncbi:hypothetical protein LO763_25540 [Glycomyces sp. A-F 0318]|uniref:hypothetical protein n=1 Tax=Glycomyces amatae TaxID=2881355 RepID=UPI001E433470|nr:hypothetical protein [Glycomyces amatae]MCD0446987.1 hypothetical protein [Glycomyces amatae]